MVVRVLPPVTAVRTVRKASGLILITPPAGGAPTSGQPVGLGDAAVGLPLFLEPRIAVVVGTTIRTQTTPATAAVNALLIHAPDTGATATVGVAHGLTVSVSAAKTAGAPAMGVAALVPTATKTRRRQGRVPTTESELLDAPTPPGVLSLGTPPTPGRVPPLVATTRTPVATTPAPETLIKPRLATTTTGISAGPTAITNAEATPQQVRSEVGRTARTPAGVRNVLGTTRASRAAAGLAQEVATIGAAPTSSRTAPPHS